MELAFDCTMFDLDGTLVINPFREFVFPEVLDRLGRDLARDSEISLSEAGKLIFNDIRRESLDRRSKGDFVGAYDWDDVVDQVRERLGIGVRVSLEETLKKYCSAKKIRAFPDARPALEELRSRGMRMLVVSNGFLRYSLPVLKVLGMEHYFERVITPDQAGYAKPQKEIFSEAMTGCDTAIFVGDSLSVDIRGARNAGLTSVLIYRTISEDLKSHPPRGTVELALSERILEEKTKSELHGGLRAVEEFVPDYLIFDLSEVVDIAYPGERPFYPDRRDYGLD